MNWKEANAFLEALLLYTRTDHAVRVESSLSRPVDFARRQGTWYIARCDIELQLGILERIAVPSNVTLRTTYRVIATGLELSLFDAAIQFAVTPDPGPWPEDLEIYREKAMAFVAAHALEKNP